MVRNAAVSCFGTGFCLSEIGNFPMHHFSAIPFASDVMIRLLIIAISCLALISGSIRVINPSASSLLFHMSTCSTVHEFDLSSPLVALLKLLLYGSSLRRKSIQRTCLPAISIFLVLKSASNFIMFVYLLSPFINAYASFLIFIHSDFKLSDACITFKLPSI